MFKIRGDSEDRTYSGAEVQYALENLHKGEHVAVEQTLPSGIIISHFVTINEHGRIHQTYGKCRAVNFVRLEGSARESA